MGWLILSIFFALPTIGGLILLISGELEKALFNLPFTFTFGFLSYYFMKKYKEKKQRNAKEEDVKIQKLEEELPVIEESPIYLKGDVLHYLEPATLLITKNKMVGRTGKTGGISVRLAKGIYARTGSYGGNPIYRDVTYTFNGQLAVTNNRILFIHPQKGFETRLKDISLIDPYSDGVSIQTKSKAYSFMLKEPRYFMALVKKVLEDNREALA